MQFPSAILITLCLCLTTVLSTDVLADNGMATLEQQFQTLPIESRRLTGPLFWLHGDESRQRLEMYLDKVAEGGNGCFTAESRPHSDWLGPNWYRDLAICLDAAKKHDLKMWIFDEKWWPSQGIGGTVPPQYAAKQLVAESVEADGPKTVEEDNYGGERYIAAIAGALTADGKIEGQSLVDLAPFVHDGKLSWHAPAGRWQIMKFTHVQAPALKSNGQVAIDGASRDCVDWFLETVYQPHYDHFKDDFGKTIPGFFYDEPETPGDWGTELNGILAAWNVDWKKAYAAYKFELAGEEQTAARYQYLDAFAEAWGRTLYGGTTEWCRAHGVKSIGHFMEQASFYRHRDYCAGDMMHLQGYSDMGGIDAVFRQFVIGQRESLSEPFTWQTPKLGSSISHVYGKPDDVTMCEIFGARGQDLTYTEMKWWTDHMQASGVNFMIPHSFNPRSPYDTDCPPYFYNGGYEPRWPLYRVYADYTSRLSLLLTGGRHVCPVALLFLGQSAQVGCFVPPEEISQTLQDSLIDCDWLPYSVLEDKTHIANKELQLYQERYQVLVVPPVEVIPYTTLVKIKAFFDAGGVVVGYGFLPTKSATLGRDSQDVTAVREAIWGKEPAVGTTPCRTSTTGGRSYFLPEKTSVRQLQQVLADADIAPSLEVLAGETDGWLHALHRVKEGQDVFLICNQNHEGKARQFKFRAMASGLPECWDAVRNEITSISFERVGDHSVEFSLDLEPLESALVVFQKRQQTRPSRLAPDSEPIREPIVLTRLPNPAIEKLPPLDVDRQKTVSPVASADPFAANFTMERDVDISKCRVVLEMDGLPDDSASVTVNGVFAGGVIGRPLRLDISRRVEAGENHVVIEPLAPKSAKIVFYPSAEQ